MIVAYDTALSREGGPDKVTSNDSLRRLVELGAQDEWEETTDHALLVLLGEFGGQLGLIERLRQVPIAQQTRRFSPQDKLIQMLVGILAGQDYLQDFTEAAQPLVKDAVVANSWGQAGFAHYSGVSRTLAMADEATLAAVIEAMDAVSEPFRQHEVLALMRAGRPLMLDLDLTGRPVSPTSTSFPGAEFGWMGDEVGKGYQAALTSLSGGPTGRLLLSVARYGGRTHSAECVQAAVRSMEEKLGVRPRRRTELVRAQVEASGVAVSAAESELERRQARQSELVAEHTAAGAEREATEATLNDLVWAYRRDGRPETPHSGLARARRRWQHAGKRAFRAERNVTVNQARFSQAQRCLEQLRTEQAERQTWLTTLESDNTLAVYSPTCQIRIDAGFSTAENLTWLVEMGYDVLTKAHSPQTTRCLGRSVTSDATWSRVGRNAAATYLGPQPVAGCPYAFHCLQVRYHLPAGQRHTTLLYYGDHPPADDLTEWFDQYNARQIIEAGIKEGKGVFPMRRPWVRSEIGLQIQEQFSLFAANFVRWAADWAADCLHHANQRITDALAEVRTLVRVVAHARANILVNALGRMLIFDDAGPFAGVALCLSGRLAYQQVLPLFHRSGPQRPCATCLRKS